MAKKAFWAKTTSLSDDVLKKEGEEVMVIIEAPRKKKSKSQRTLGRKKKEGIEQEEWLPDSGQGQLVVDVYEKGDELVIESAIAGVSVSDVDITVEPDLIVIRGERKKKETSTPRRYYYQECFWGKFSRTLVLPHPVKPEKVKANLKNGILIIILPKAEEKSQNVEISE